LDPPEGALDFRKREKYLCEIDEKNLLLPPVKKAAQTGVEAQTIPAVTSAELWREELV
jgi:hypothetical protein